MGVTGLWTILEPAHRPVKLETLAKKRLAIDASIWIYQFLKAVRDAEGNALRNSHIVGFFRRICKLLFHGVRPVFVFDGGAPALKRQTIAGRITRREGRKEDAARTAGKLLALQVKRRAEEEAERRKSKRYDNDNDNDEIPDDVVYVDELEQTAQQRKQNRKFKRTDQYQLPEMDHEFHELGAPNDPRIMSQEEIQEYARQFDGMEDFNLYDFSNMDFSSPFFNSLPERDRYRILNAARVRSRLRMGYTKEQLDSMFPDRMAFSKFQIERVSRRNELSQRVMNIQGWDNPNGVLDVSRVAGEKGREYALVRNEGADGGWALSFIGQKGETEGDRNKPILIESTQQPKTSEEDDEEASDDEFEDVPIEGLNRLPKLDVSASGTGLVPGWENEEAEMLRKALYESRLNQVGGSRKTNVPKNVTNGKARRPDNPLFLGDELEDLDDTLIPMDIEGNGKAQDTEDEDLRRAIAMSYEGARYDQSSIDNEDEELQRAIALSQQQNYNPAHVNGKGKSRDASPADYQEGDFQRAALESLQMHKSQQGGFNTSGESSKSASNNVPFFQDLDLGSSPSIFARSGEGSRPATSSVPSFKGLDLSNSSSFLLKKIDAPREPEKSKSEQQAPEKSKIQGTEEDKPIPLPPWFAPGSSGNIERDLERVREQTNKDAAEFNRSLEAERAKNIVDIESSDDDSEVEMLDLDFAPEKSFSTADVADRLRAAPPKPVEPSKLTKPIGNRDTDANVDLRSTTIDGKGDSDEELEWGESDHETGTSKATAKPSPHVEDISLAAKPVSSPPPTEMEEPDDLDFDLYRDPTPPPPEMDQEDLDEQELLLQMAREEEEHARFAVELNPAQREEGQSREQAMEEYQRELKSLRSQQKKDRRDADEVTQVMIQECQQLLKLFGLPYITAPMEAEAQCAELVRLGLVDGIVTDDSDVFLFGGTRVYRYMFNDKQVVQCYLTSDLEKEFGLDRKKLISAAHLLGSDYTEGIPNIGPVTAVELLAEFKDDGGLEGFKEWWSQVQQGREKPEEAKNSFRQKFHKNAAKIFVPPVFPDVRVDEAYLHPEVDSDPSEFAWGVPDLDALRTFLMSSIGWDQARTDQVLLPVVRDMNLKVREGTQRNITSFFGEGSGAGAFAPRVKTAMSGRLQKALEKIKEGGMDAPGAGPISMREGAKRKKAAAEEEGDEDSDSPEEVERPAPMSMREAAKRRAEQDAAEKEAEAPEPISMAQGTKRRKRTRRAENSASAEPEQEESEAEVGPVKKKRGARGKARGRGGRGGRTSTRKRAKKT